MGEDPNGSHDRVSHDGPRSPKGGRMSYVSSQVSVWPHPDETYGPGESYTMPMLQFHETPNSGVVVTLMEKLTEGEIHAASLIARGHEFDQDFDRFQLLPEELWGFVVDALKEGAPEFIEYVDDIIEDLEEQFGSARCGYSGQNLAWPKEERACECEECQDSYVARWPTVDAQDGCSWWRLDWPEGIETVPHPWLRRERILAEHQPPVEPAPAP